MSHFTVLVHVPADRAQSAAAAAASVADLLEPFSIHRSVPHNETLDAEEIARALKYSTHAEVAEPDDEQIRDAIQQWTGAELASISKLTTGEWSYVDTDNPDGHWDWWTIGGRWRGFLTLRPGLVPGVLDEDDSAPSDAPALLGQSGAFYDPPDADFAGRADVARKGDVDLEGAMNEVEINALAAYAKYEEVTAGLPLPPRWDEFRTTGLIERGIDPNKPADELTDEDKQAIRAAMQEIRLEWAEQPWVDALRRHQIGPIMGDQHDYWCVHEADPPATFVERARASVVLTHAFLTGGQWHQQGVMLMFAVVADEKPPEVWHEQFTRLYEAVPDEDWLVLVDCHQ